jgi:hypothetical protein
MRFDDRTMEELHRRVDELQVALWGVTEQKEAQVWWVGVGVSVCERGSMLCARASCRAVL